MNNLVKYLGDITDADGLHTAPDKVVDAIKKAPRPENLHQPRSLGLVNYFGKFLPASSTRTHSLYQLMQADQK